MAKELWGSAIWESRLVTTHNPKGSGRHGRCQSLAVHMVLVSCWSSGKILLLIFVEKIPKEKGQEIPGLALGGRVIPRGIKLERPARVAT